MLSRSGVLHDCDLSPLGEKQIAFEMKTKPEHLQVGGSPVKVAFVSPLWRAVRTALAAFPKASLVLLPDLCEVGTCFGLNVADVRGRVQSAGFSSRSVDYSRVNDRWWEGVEPRTDGKAAVARVRRALLTVRELAGDKPCAVVCHGNVIDVAMGRHKWLSQTYDWTPEVIMNPPLPLSHCWRRGCVMQTFPNNFFPYRGTISKEGVFVPPCSPPNHEQGERCFGGSVLMLRHAHSADNKAEEARKRAEKSAGVAARYVCKTVTHM